MFKNASIDIAKSSGNVFMDLQLPNPEEHLYQAELAHCTINLLRKRGLAQKAAANLLDIDQSELSALRKGRLSGFSVERLFRFLTILNQDIEIIIKPHIKNKRVPSIPHVHVRNIEA